MAGSGVKPSSESAFLAESSSDSARARISLVASKALTAAAAESEADFYVEECRRRGGEAI